MGIGRLPRNRTLLAGFGVQPDPRSQPIFSPLWSCDQKRERPGNHSGRPASESNCALLDIRGRARVDRQTDCWPEWTLCNRAGALDVHTRMTFRLFSPLRSMSLLASSKTLKVRSWSGPIFFRAISRFTIGKSSCQAATF